MTPGGFTRFVSAWLDWNKSSYSKTFNASMEPFLIGTAAIGLQLKPFIIKLQK